MHRSGQRYQRSRVGKLLHAARQARYRHGFLSVDEIVTHQGVLSSAKCGSVKEEVISFDASSNRPYEARHAPLRCVRCGCLCA